MATNIDELAATLGLKVVRSQHWGARFIMSGDGRVLADIGIDAVSAWLQGYKVARDEAPMTKALPAPNACEEKCCLQK